MNAVRCAALLCAAAVVVSCGGPDGTAALAGSGPTTSGSAPATAATGEPSADSADPSTTSSTPPDATPSVTAEPPTPDELAGVLRPEVVQRGTGATIVVPGSAPAPGPGEEKSVRVEVEGGMPIDGQAFARFVMVALNDPRSWAADGLAFSRTDGEADIVVVLASPDTSEAMCRPLRTFGKVSCSIGKSAIINSFRWVEGMEDYGSDLTGYRQYVTNHEVGHVLGHGHVPCPEPGAVAPVMQQQTLDVDPCLPNPWPYP